MSLAEIVATFLGALIICSRGPLIFVPASTLRWFRMAIATEGRTRVLGVIIVFIAVAMVWAGLTENSDLASVMLIFGMFFLVVVIPALVLFPQTYMSVVDSVLPDDLDGDLFGWRILGLVGVVIGVVIFMIGIRAL